LIDELIDLSFDDSILDIIGPIDGLRVLDAFLPVKRRDQTDFFPGQLLNVLKIVSGVPLSYVPFYPCPDQFDGVVVVVVRRKTNDYVSRSFGKFV